VGPEMGPPRLLGVSGSFLSGPGQNLSCKSILVNFSLENTAASSSFHHFSVGKKCYNCSLSKIVPGQNGYIVGTRAFFAVPVESAPMVM